jgi:hypothetical protein
MPEIIQLFGEASLGVLVLLNFYNNWKLKQKVEELEKRLS